MPDFSKDLSLYFHWPYCRSKCPYCDFFSRVRKNVPQDEIIKEYLCQLESYKALVPERTIVSVFFGGGTPSLISPKNIEKILNKIDVLWGLNSFAEISLEANPNTQTPTLFSDLRKSGINRLSLGVQSLEDTELKFLGRTHTLKDAETALESVLKNFENTSADMIYALPSQTPKSWQTSLERLSSFGLKHLSLYQLTVEEGTVFERKGIKPLAEEKAAELYLMTEKILKKKNYDKYEVSNYAQKGFASKHNLAYWTGQDYIGIGPSAHGRLKTPDGLFAQTNPFVLEKLIPTERAEELLMMGLRVTKGLNKKRFEQICGLNFDAFINQKFKDEALQNMLLKETSQTLKATPKGFLILDYLIQGLCP